MKDKVPGFVHPDISYRATWKKSGRLFARLVEETVFQRDHDGTLKVAIKARKVPDETAEYEKYKDRITEILDALAEEKKAELEETKALAAPLESEETNDKSNSKSSKPDPTSPEEYWYKDAERRFISQCFLIPEPAGGETALVTAIQGTPLSGKKGQHGVHHVLIHFDQKLAGESSSRPALRCPPFVEDKYTKLMKSAIKSRSGSETVLLDSWESTMLLSRSAHAQTVEVWPCYCSLN